MSNQTVSVLTKLKTSLERAGAKIPCENHGTIESAMRNGLSIALLLVTEELEALQSSAPQAVTTPPPAIDYDKLIADCFKTTGARQGERRCIAFARGAEWYRNEVVCAKQSSGVKQ